MRILFCSDVGDAPFLEAPAAVRSSTYTLHEVPQKVDREPKGCMAHFSAIASGLSLLRRISGTRVEVPTCTSGEQKPWLVC
jgi:hypothetical protein